MIILSKSKIDEQKLHEAYNEYNTRYFNELLPKDINIQIIDNDKVKYEGQARHKNNEYNILINAHYLDEAYTLEIHDTLLHEMIHIMQYSLGLASGHGKSFTDKCAEINKDGWNLKKYADDDIVNLRKFTENCINNKCNIFEEIINFKFKTIKSIIFCTKLITDILRNYNISYNDNDIQLLQKNLNYITMNDDIKIIEELNDIINKDDNIEESEWQKFITWKNESAIWDINNNGEKTKISDCLMNIVGWLDNYPEVKGKFAINDITMRLMYNGKENKNIENDLIKQYCKTMLPKFSKIKLFHDAIIICGANHICNPVIEYFNSLGEWDGKDDALREVLIDLFKIDENDEYFDLYYEELKKTLVAAITRLFYPGTKYDQITVFCSKNGGTGKSTFIKELSRINDVMYCVEKNSRSINFNNKDTLMEFHSAWFFSMDEIDVRRDIVTIMKTLLQQEEDVFRKPYGYDTESFKRKFIFVGTSNNDDFLKDYTTMYERRWWIIKVTEDEKNGEYIKKVFEKTDIRDRIWKQVYHLYKTGDVSLWLEDPIMKDKLFKLQQGYKYISNDEYDDVINLMEREYAVTNNGNITEECMFAQIKSDYTTHEFMNSWNDMLLAKEMCTDELRRTTILNRIPKTFLYNIAKKLNYDITKKGLDLAMSKNWNKKQIWYNGRTTTGYVRKGSFEDTL